ncbi:kinase-like domain-containing protein [Nemania sp. FL0031]|nr:kinase-like domain-containing protein [Nemania sp. FL0031]
MDSTSFIPRQLGGNGPSLRITSSGPKRIRKEGDAFRILREAEAMDFVRKNTSLPVPAVFETQIGAEPAFSSLIMEEMPGRQLGQAWPNMSDAARSRAISMLKQHLAQLHDLRPPSPGWVGSCSEGPAYDHRITNLNTCGPFNSIGAFHDFLVAPVRDCPKPELADSFRLRLSDDHEIVFAHADISAENILVDETTGDITAILDWEMAGYWPSWWEYRKALYGGRNNAWWRPIVGQIMEEYKDEAELDMDIEMF